MHFLDLPFSAIFDYVWFYFSQSVFSKLCCSVMLLEYNADFVTLIAPL